MQQREIGRRRGQLFTAAVLLATGALAGPVDSLQPGQWYEFPNSSLSANVPSPVPAGSVDSMLAYSGGTFDSKRNRLLVWGGGHAAYAGNEVYAFSLASGTWTRLTEPSATPVAVHTYDQLAYLPAQDAMLGFGGSVWGSGSATPATWVFDLNTKTWTNTGNMPGTVYSFWYYNMNSDFDPVSGKVVVIGLTAGATYDPALKQWTLGGSGHGDALGTTGALDLNKRVFVEAGRGLQSKYAVAANGMPGNEAALTAGGPQNIVACNAPGLTYDAAIKRVVGWCSGPNVYSLDLDANTWVQHNPSNAVNPGAPANNTNGTFGRWAYSPASNVYVLVSGAYKSVYAYRLSSGTGTPTPTPTPTPAVSLSANPTTVANGGSTALSWSAQNVSTCTAAGAWSGSRATSGQQTLSNLTSSGTFTLNCSGSNGAASDSVAVTVQAASGGGSSGGGSSGGGSSGGGAAGGSTSGSTGVSVAANADWASRSAGPGVVRALGFDTQAEWLSHVPDTNNCYAEYAPGCRRNAWDQVVKASGAGSVRFDIKSNSHEGAAGNVAVNFAEDYSAQFGANSEFWVQWRQRFDDFVITHDYQEIGGPGGEWKQIILSQGDRWLANGSVLMGYACSEDQVVVGNAGARDYPNAFNECGRYMPFEQYLPGVGYTRQNQRVDANGATTCQSYPMGGNTSGCLRYVGNEWMTFMVHLQLGPEGRARSSSSGIDQPGLINSTYELYVARQGQPLQIAHRQANLVIPRGQFWLASNGVNPDDVDDPGYVNGWSAHDAHPQAEFGKIWLTPFHTHKDPAETHQNASIWYDELIVSTQAIAAPGAAPTPTPTPVKPTVSLLANSTTVAPGAKVTLTWSSQNATSCTAFRGWKGSRATSGQQVLGPLTAGTNVYSLGCRGAGGSAYRNVIVKVQ